MFLGSTRKAGPPRPVRVGDRVAKFIEESVTRRGHEIVRVVNPVEIDLPLLEKPHFAYAKKDRPPILESLANDIQRSDAYVMITPEYNHTCSPGYVLFVIYICTATYELKYSLMNTLNHFGSSIFSFKPSCIVSYSQGQWGGVRAAHALRAPLSELGCLPVSSMVHVPKAHVELNADGVPSENEDRWYKYADRTISQLEWWGHATKIHRKDFDPFDSSKAFQRDPSQRNAP